jgi:hypothetical protein
VRTAVLIALVALVVVATAGARTREDDTRHLALETMKTNLTSAITAEKEAWLSFHSGKIAAGEHWLSEAEAALDGSENAAKYLTVPSDLDNVFPDSAWGNVSKHLNDALTWDRRAAKGNEPTKTRGLLIGDALVRKKDLLTLVTGELTHPMCSELINLEGPVEVNGVPQGSATLTVEASCTQPEKSIYIDIPLDAIESAAPEGTASAKVEDGGHVLELDLNGAKSGGASLQTSPDASGGQPFSFEVVPIHGSGEYFDEVM